MVINSLAEQYFSIPIANSFSTMTALYALLAGFKETTSCTRTHPTATKRITKSSPIVPTRTLRGCWSQSSMSQNALEIKTFASPGKNLRFAGTASSNRWGVSLSRNVGVDMQYD